MNFENALTRAFNDIFSQNYRMCVLLLMHELFQKHQLANSMISFHKYSFKQRHQFMMESITRYLHIGDIQIKLSVEKHLTLATLSIRKQ